MATAKDIRLKAWDAVLAKDIKTICSDMRQHLEHLPKRCERLKDDAYLEQVLAKLVSKAKQVYLTCNGEHSMFRYFMMLSIQGITAFSGKDGVPNYIYACAFDRIERMIIHDQESWDESHSRFIIEDLSCALTRAREDNKALRDDAVELRRDAEAARNEVIILRRLNNGFLFKKSPY